MPSNLDRIKDIDPAREKWLNEQGIETYAHLAAADPSWIYAQLKNTDKPPVSLKKIQGWIEEAKRITATPSPPEAPVTLPPVDPQSRNTVTEDGWNEFASFYISYQHKHANEDTPLRTQIVYRTYADHIEENDNQQWDGIQGDDLCQWIMRHVATIMEKNPLATVPPNIPSTAEAAEIIAAQPTKPSEISIVSLLVRDPVGGFAIATAGESFNGIAHAKQPLTFDFNLKYRLPYSEEAATVETGDCHLSCYIYAIPSNKLVLQQQKKFRQTLESGQTNDTVIMGITELPAGLYRIRAIATLDNQTPVLNIIDIPLLQII